MPRGPLAGRYPAAAAMVMCALIPYLGLSAALQPLTPIIAKQLHMGLQTMSLASGMANAAYAVGTVLAVQFAQHLPQRRMLVIYATLLVAGSALAAAATGPAMFIAGHVLQGLCTSLLLIAAVPPLIIGFPASKMRWTAIIMNMCIFGAVALGPLVGGLQAQSHAWRPLFWVIAAIALAALALTVLTFEDVAPADRSAPRGPLAIAISAVGCVAAFYGASELLTHRFLGLTTFLPLVAGVALIAILFVYQHRTSRPLLCVSALASTLPVAGIVVAMCAAAASVSAIGLAATALAQRYSPLHLGLLQFPEFGGAAVTAVLLGVVFRTRALHYLVLGGMLCLGLGIALLGNVIPPTSTLTLVGSGLIGLGVGAAVAPALFIAGFSLASQVVQRVFAIVELLRAVAAFMIVPILTHLAATVAGGGAAGTSVALWICFGLAIGGVLAAVALYGLGGIRPPSPDIDRWMDGDEPAWESPPLLDAVRERGRTSIIA